MSTMRRKEREVTDPKLIAEMLKVFDQCVVCMFDEDGYPYAVPMSPGWEMDENGLKVYIHCAPAGHKMELMRKNPHVCVVFSAFQDFPETPYKGHKHDYRSIIAKGTVTFYDGHDNYDIYKRGHTLTHTCNHRPEHALSPDRIPPMLIGVIDCPRDQVTAKAEFPVKNIEDVPFRDIRIIRGEVPEDFHEELIKNM